MTPKKVSDIGLDAIRSFEGLYLTAYRCPAGILTIGYGHTSCVHSGDIISLDDAERLLLDDLTQIESRINSEFPWLNQDQFDAIASFIFNVGWLRFRSSTLYARLIDHAAPDMVARQVIRWTLVNGKKMYGLCRRRAWEANAYLGKVVYAARKINGVPEIYTL